MTAVYFLPESMPAWASAFTRSAWLEIVNGALNRLAGVVLLLVFSPLMILTIVLIAFHGGAPVIFSHYRVGRRGNLFKCFKFRTMHVDAQRMLGEILRKDPVARAEWEREQKLSNDPRITPIGRFLRKTSLDELPQIFNVIRGEMNVVGPRPITVDELDRYGRERWHYLAIAPGMTGLWQVSGRNELSYAERVALDRQYVETRSLWLDISILFRTVAVVLNRNGAR